MADRAILDAELVTGLRPDDLIQIDREWLPLRQRVVRALNDAGVSSERWPESSGWNWVKKSAALGLMAIRGFGIRIDERWIGVSMINVAQYTAKLAPDQRKPLVYLEFIETAPDCWPVKIPTTLIRRSNQTQGRIKMLVLSRKVGEKLVIDGNITVEVVKVQGNRITIGIQAPSDVKVLRGELMQPKAKTQTVELVVEDGLLVAC